MPEVPVVALKKSKILLLLISMPLFLLAAEVVVPIPYIAFAGKFAPAGPILQFEMVLLSLPFTVTPSVEK